MLDQRIAGERADDVEARDLRLVSFRDLGVRGGTVTRELDAARFDKPPRWQGPDSRNDSVAFDARLTLSRIQHEISCFDQLGLGI